MSLLSDEKKVMRFIDCDEPCPNELLIEYYLKCRRLDMPVPQKVEEYVNNCLSKILRFRNRGLKPLYADIFCFSKISNRNKVRSVTNENEILLTGFAVEEYIAIGDTREIAVTKAAEYLTGKFNRSFSVDAVNKAYNAFKKIHDSQDGFDQKGYD